MATAAVSRSRSTGLFARPTATRGLAGWLTTVDHKKIGLMYGATALSFLLIGGFEALLIRTQLARPEMKFLSAEAYNQVFTMHGTTMVFLVVMPLSAAFFNYLIPLQIGARDVAFPRLNAFSFWAFLLGGLFMYSSFILGGAANGGWFGYANLTSQYLPGNGINFWIIGLQIMGIGSMVASANFIVTILNMRAPGMSLMKMPIFIWMTLVVAFLTLFAMPVIAVALFLLMFDRMFGANFFNVMAGGEPILWQHLFWLFGHPEVYILILPAMGIVSEVLPTFARKPLFGYAVVVFSGIAIGFVGWGVWAHHMFAVGLGPASVTAFSLSTMFIAIPTGVKIFNWLGTLWKGKLKFTTAMLFALGFIAMFVIGGLSGVTHAVSPADTQQTDTYYVVAHFHYVLFGGAMFGIFSGIYFWYPKVVGRLMSERLGKWHFWTMLLGFNMTFFPFHILGLQGMPRRIYTYAPNMGWNFWNLFSTLGSYILGASILIFFWNAIKSRRKGEIAGPDPWDGRTLEWSIPSPPPEYNFGEIPKVTTLDEFWHRKYKEDEDGRLVRVEPPLTEEEAEVANAPRGHIHMPSPSYFPLVAAVGLPVIGYGVIYWKPAAALGLLITLAGLYGWAFEPSSADE